jgi:hypothetical protein
VRLSLGRDTTAADVDTLLQALRRMDTCVTCGRGSGR